METQTDKVSPQNLRASFRRGLRKLWWLILLLAILGGSVMGASSWIKYTPRYTAAATFSVYVDNSIYSGVTSYNQKAAEQMEKRFRIYSQVEH